MLIRLLLIFTVIIIVSAIDKKSKLLNYTQLQSCAPTFKMLDSSGNLPAGLMTGNLIDLGNFDQCLRIDEIYNKSEIVQGKYCLMRLTLPKDEKKIELLLETFKNNFGYPKPKVVENTMDQRLNNSSEIILGWCLPHDCLVDTFSADVTSYLEEVELEMKVAPFNGGFCQIKDDLLIEYDTNSIIFILFICATFFLMILSTFYDMYIQYHKIQPAHIILVALSIKTNGQKLLTVSNNADQLLCLNGIRFLSMMWIVYFHRFTAIVKGPLANTLDYKYWLNNPANMFLLNAPVAVDTFFVLTGLLVAYIFCLTLDRGAKFNIILYYLHRYLRLTPVLAVVVWFHTTIIGFFGSGPFWPFTVMTLKTPCVNNWWVTLVYIQNYYHTKQVCVAQSWYLAVDMQLFILSPIILIPIWRWPKQTMMASAVLILGSIAAGFIMTYVEDLASFVINDKEHWKVMRYYYIPTHTRFGPWLMGLMLGYYLYKLKKRKVNNGTKITMRPSQVAFGWIVSLGLLLSTLFAGHDLMLHSDKLGNSFFNGFHRHGWALGVCWVIYACTQGYGGPINSFLSCSLFQILSRFSYSIYLVHLSVEELINGSSKTNNYFEDFRMIHGFWGDFIVSFVIAVCLTLAYESPMVTIEKVIFGTGHKPEKLELPVLQNAYTSERTQTKIS